MTQEAKLKFPAKMQILLEVNSVQMKLWTLFSSKLDSSVIKTLETHFFTLSECVSNVLISFVKN